jgi:hypothetical protein
MAAGLGFKDFVTGEVLTAADVDGYLMQGVWVFASAAARDAAVTSPQEGNFAYLKDTNVTTYYTGSAWANLDTTGMTNPMTTTGDTIYSSSGSTPARLGIGSTGQVLTVAGGIPSWATPAAGGGMTLLATTSLTGSSTDITSISGSYKQLFLLLTDVYGSSTNDFRFRFNSDTSGSNYYYNVMFQENASYNNQRSSTAGYLQGGNVTTSSTQLNKLNGSILIPNYTSTGSKYVKYDTMSISSAPNNVQVMGTGLYIGGSAISSVTILNSAGTFSGGTVLTYGVN